MQIYKLIAVRQFAVLFTVHQFSRNLYKLFRVFNKFSNQKCFFAVLLMRKNRYEDCHVISKKKSTLVV